MTAKISKHANMRRIKESRARMIADAVAWANNRGDEPPGGRVARCYRPPVQETTGRIQKTETENQAENVIWWHIHTLPRADTRAT